MGWDAWAAHGDGKELDREIVYDYEARRDIQRIVDSDLRKAFEEASTLVIDKCNCADGLLKCGGLDVSCCCEVLEYVSGMDCYDDEGWSLQDVKRVHEIFESHTEEEFSIFELIWYWSAREFIRVCAENGLSIQFTY